MTYITCKFHSGYKTKYIIFREKIESGFLKIIQNITIHRKMTGWKQIKSYYSSFFEKIKECSRTCPKVVPSSQIVKNTIFLPRKL